MKAQSKLSGGIVIGESPVEAVCRRLLDRDKLPPTTMRANEVVTRIDELRRVAAARNRARAALGRRTATMLQNHSGPWPRITCDVCRCADRIDTVLLDDALESFGLHAYPHVAHPGLDSFPTSRAKASAA